MPLNRASEKLSSAVYELATKDALSWLLIVSVLQIVSFVARIQ